jgi:hypothetical protein
MQNCWRKAPACTSSPDSCFLYSRFCLGDLPLAMGNSITASQPEARELNLSGIKRRNFMQNLFSFPGARPRVAWQIEWVPRWRQTKRARRCS